MESRDDLQKNESCSKKKYDAAPSGSMYGLAFIGAAVYYIQQAHTFWMILLGILKALVWPAIMVYEIMKFVRM